MDTPTPLRALIIEDSEDDALLLLNTIKRAGFAPTYLRLDTRDELQSALNHPWDIVFSDFTMPAFNGHEALQLVRSRDRDVPFFFVSGTIGEDNAVEAMRLGAQDYFIKGNLKRIPSAIHRELRDSARRRSHRLAEERVHYLANYDALTGLPNRALFNERLRECLETAPGVAVFNLNLKRFRDVNEYLGAAAGDAMLIELGARLRAAFKPQDTVARIAADEFALISTGLGDRKAVESLAEHILNLLERPFSLLRYEWRIRGSLGSSFYPGDGAGAGELLGSAAIALNHARQMQGNAYTPYSHDLREVLQAELLLGRDLEQAIETNAFTLHYQPQIKAATGQLIGLEALIRWHRPGHGPVSPAEFIPLAEASGLIMPIGEWVLREACRQMQAWHKDGRNTLRVAVNLSAFQFRQRGLVSTIKRVLEERALPPQCLEVEITETALMQDAEAARITLMRLRELGISIALDDFGTGYSSLSYLKRFPVDVLKIDRSFIDDLPHDLDAAAIVNAIIAMADKLGLQVVAEGVETAEQLAFLQNAGCELVQGYYIQRPKSAAELFLDGNREATPDSDGQQKKSESMKTENPGLRVLIVEDNEADYLLLERQINRLLPGAVCIRAARRSDLIVALGSHWDLIVSDYHLPDIEEDALLTVIADAQPSTPCVVLSGSLRGTVAAKLPGNVISLLEKGDRAGLHRVLTGPWYRH